VTAAVLFDWGDTLVRAAERFYDDPDDRGAVPDARARSPLEVAAIVGG
jgi:hypothetical protein